VDDSYAKLVDHQVRPVLGNWTIEDSIHCDATGTYAYAFLSGPNRDDVLLDVTIEPNGNTEAAGILIEPRGEDHLDSGYSLAIEPMKERVVFDRWPAPMDPLWDSLVLNERHGIEVTPEIDSPLVERPLAFTPKDGRYRVQLLRNGSAIECFVAGQVVASFRIYDISNTNAWGVFVQEGAATFHNLGFRE
jgi:beta-fructofuranosidase